jgi:hypothetical protein
LDKKHFGQKAFGTIDTAPYTSTLTFRVENTALVLSCRLKFVHEMPDLNKNNLHRQTDKGGRDKRVYSKNLFLDRKRVYKVFRPIQ